MSETARFYAAVAFQAYPALLIAVNLAVFAPAGIAAATSLVLLLTVVDWARSHQHVPAPASGLGRFTGA